MSKGIGRQVQFGIAKESSRGTAESAATYYIPFDSLSLDEKWNLVQDEQSRGVIEDAVGASQVKQWVEGSVKAPIGDKHFPLVLLSILGSLSTGDNADSDSSIKDHTVTVGQSSQHPSLSLFIDDPVGGQDYKHALGVITSLELDFELAKFLSYSANFKAKKGATATLTPSATSGESRFLPQHLTFGVASDLSGLASPTAIKVKSLTLKIDQNIEDDDVLGSIAPNDFLNKQMTIEGTVEALWQNESDFKTAALAGTAKAVQIAISNTDVTIGNAAHPGIVIQLAKVIFKDLTRPIAINDLIKQTLSFKAYYSTSDTQMINAVITNAVASY